MRVQLIAKPVWVFPEHWDRPVGREDQLQGSDGATLCEFAGRICYDSLGSGRSSADYHKHILDVEHGSVLEHAQYSFFVSGVSRGLTHELVRHRVGVAFSQRSTRYVNESNSKVIHHPLFERYSNLTLRNDVAELEHANRLLYEDVYFAVFDGLVKDGVDKATAKKQARGAARQYLENGLETELVFSANIRSLRHIINMRGSIHADAEIRQLAVGLYEIMSSHCPEYFSDGVKGDSPDGIQSISIKPV